MVASIFVTHIFLTTLSHISIKFAIFAYEASSYSTNWNEMLKQCKKHKLCLFLINVAANSIAVEKEKPISVIMQIFYPKRILRDFHVSCLELRIVIGSVWQLLYNALAP